MPETVVSHADPAQQASVPLLRFLRGVRSRVPNRATLALVTGSAEGAIPFLIAIGQLPDQRVLPGFAMDSEAAASEWVACFGQTFQNPRYIVVDSFEGGLLLRRQP